MKKSKFISYAFAAILGLCVSLPAFAAPAADGPGASCEGLRFASGPKGKGYSKLFANIQKVCGSEVALCEVTSSGGLDNLNFLSTKKADVGIAQIDTYQSMKIGDDNIAGLLQVAGLNSNFLHVITAANGFAVQGEKKFGFLKGDVSTKVIRSFSDLKGQRVTLVGSAQLLGSQLNKSLSMGMVLDASKNDQEAFSKLLKGEVAAVLSVSGWPHGALEDLNMNSGLSMVSFDMPAPPGFNVKPLNYKGIGVYNVNSLGAQNILFTRPFKVDNVAEVAKLKACLARKLPALQDGAYEPAWNEIKNLDSSSDIPKFVSGNGKK